MQVSGSDSAAAQAINQQLYIGYLDRIPTHRTEILWSGPIYIALFAFVLIGLLFLFVYKLRHVNLIQSKLYELTSFSGQIDERIGKISTFNFISWIGFIVWAGYFAVKHILFGVSY